MAFIDKVRAWWRTASMLEALIAINVVVFVVLRLIMTAQLLFNVPGDGLMRWVELPSQPATLLSRPWTVITYMFAHVDFLHILFNMLWFYWLGRIFMDYFHPKQLASLYVMGGLGGAALYLLAYNLLPVFSHQPSFLLGASASILAIVVATAAYVPDYKIGLLFIGPVSLKWVAGITVLLDFLSIGSANSGGHIAHLGGALMGLWFGLSIARGTDITRPVTRLLDAIVTWWPPFRRRNATPGVGQPIAGNAYHGPLHSTVSERELDEILAKITRSGYASLTAHERDVLNRASRNR